MYCLSNTTQDAKCNDILIFEQCTSKKNFRTGIWRLVLVPLTYAALEVVQCASPNSNNPAKNNVKVPDCTGFVGFSAVGASAVRDTGILSFKSIIVNYENSLSEVTVFTCKCAGIYHITFAGACESQSRLVLKKRDVKTSAWSAVVSTMLGGGSNSIVYPLAVGEQLALFVQGSPPRIKYDSSPSETYTSFSAFRLN